MGAGSLRQGDRLITVKGQTLLVIDISKDNFLHETYNFEVSDYHTYFVGDQGVWVHNACVDPKITVGRTKDGGPRIKQEFPDGRQTDITDKRVKEYVPNNHPKAPKGAMQKVKFDKSKSQPGSKRYKRNPTKQEIRLLDKHR